MENSRKTATIGDLLIDKDRATKEDKTVERDGEVLQCYTLNVYIPDDVDEAGIGEPSLVLKKGQFLNARAYSSAEKEAMPEWKRDLAVAKFWVAMNRKQYTKNKK